MGPIAFWKGLPRATRATLVRIPMGIWACALVLLIDAGLLPLSWPSVVSLVLIHAFNGWTDFMDGRWARQDGNTGPAGEALDHWADKLGNNATFVACTLADWIPGGIACFLVIRDCLSSMLRECRYATNELDGDGTKRSLSGAIKTWGVFLLLGAAPLNALIATAWSQWILRAMLAAFVGVLVWSTVSYLLRHWPKIAPHLLRQTVVGEPSRPESRPAASVPVASSHDA